jgi:branched-chain amino acid transport system substrate-binding protein
LAISLCSSWCRFSLSCGLLWCLAVGSAWSAEAGITADEIVVGQSLTLQGGKDTFGVSVGQGMKLYFDEANAAGGVYGRKIVTRVLDDAGQGPAAEANARKLVADGAFILFGSVGGAPSSGVMKVATELGVPFFGQLAGTPALRRPHQPMVFPVRAEHRDEFRAMMVTGKEQGLRTVGFLYADSEVGKQHLENVKIAAQELGMTLTMPLPVKADITDAQIDDAVKAMGQIKPGLFIHNGPAKVFQKIVQKAKAAGVRTTFMGVNQGSYEIAKALGPLAQGIVFTQVVPSPWERKRELTRDYQDAARRASPTAEFSYGALEGYMTAKALVLALRAAGKQPTRASFIKGLEGAKFDLGGLTMRFSSGDHEGSKFVDLSLVSRDARFIQ